MKTQDLAEQLYPYSFGAEKRVVDGKRSAFVAGYNYKKTKKPFRADDENFGFEQVDFIINTLVVSDKKYKTVSKVIFVDSYL